MTEPEGQLVNGQKQGEWKSFYKLSGKLARVETYRNDTLNGPCLVYWSDGRLYDKVNYRKGVRVDSFIHYHSNGRPNLETWYDCNGKEQGLFKVYDDNGAVRQVGYNKDGYFEGEVQEFYPNGQVKSIEYYKDKMKQGTWTYYDENGKLLRMERYSNDSLLHN